MSACDGGATRRERRRERRHGVRALGLALATLATLAPSPLRAQDGGEVPAEDAAPSARADGPPVEAAAPSACTAEAPPEHATPAAGTGEAPVADGGGAEEPREVTPAPVTAPAAPPPRPYSVPWNLRPLPAVNLLRFDHALGLHDAYGPVASGLESSFAQLVTLGWRVANELMLVARWGWDWTSRSGDVGASTILLGANVAMRFEDVFRLSVFLATTVPTGGSNGSPSHRDARLLRAAMDNAMFLPGHMAGIGGVGFAWVDQGWTVQVEAGLFVLGRATAPSDDVIVNATFGAHLGYYVIPELTVSGELHHQHFLSDPVALRRAPPAADDFGGELRSQTSGTLGLRAHWNVAGSVWARPGIAWTIGFDAPMAGDAWQVVQLDLPIFF